MHGLIMDRPLLISSFLEYASSIYGAQEIVSRTTAGDIHRYTYRQADDRIRRLSKALIALGVDQGDRIATLAWNDHRHYELYFATSGMGAVCHTLNPRLHPSQLTYIMNNASDRILFVDPTFMELLASFNATLDSLKAVVVMADAADMPETSLPNVHCYETLVADNDGDFTWPEFDERTASSLCYTSGTTGNPKGVVYHHRGAYLNAVSNQLAQAIPPHPVYLWTLPMFHCNGWCFPWTITALAGTHVCLRRVEAGPVFDAIADHNVGHFCGAPIVLNMLANAPDDARRAFSHTVEAMTAGASPPAAVIEAMENQGFHVTHVYGLTETYGPDTVCAWHEEWDELPVIERAALKARQGVAYPLQEGIMVADPDTMTPVPKDGETMGEIMHRGNIVMKGYLKNKTATGEAFSGGWFHSGDLGVWHEDGYVELKDRSKDIIISGGENISSIEIESVLYRHPAVLEAAVAARPDDKWGETPCAFVTLRADGGAKEAEIIAYCRDNMAHFKAPKTVVFGPLPKTSTGKIQKFVLREHARSLGSL
ncbi:MAG: long-chain-fatty-acid--CoA ligase [Rhodospirillaceae bacterium]|nr:long-chain-fatty-acid--CoA ligase [Rhodospirillaceae bacterium]